MASHRASSASALSIESSSAYSTSTGSPTSSAPSSPSTPYECTGVAEPRDGQHDARQQARKGGLTNKQYHDQLLGESSERPGAAQGRGGYHRKTSQFIPVQKGSDQSRLNEDERVSKRAAKTILKAWTRIKAFQVAKKLALKVYQKYYDYDSGGFYYVNSRLGTTMWVKPTMLGMDDLPEATEGDRVEVSACPAFPSNWIEMRLSHTTIWGSVLACLRPINVYEAQKPQRFLFRSCSHPPAEIWEYRFSVFAFVSPLVPIGGTLRYVVSDCDDKYQRGQVASPTSCDNVSGTQWDDRFEFHAFHQPTPGTVQLNVQQVSYPTRFRLTTEPAAGYWLQRFHFFSFPASRYNVQFSTHPHRYIVESDVGASEAFPGWRDAFSFYAFDLPIQGSTRIEIHERLESTGVRSEERVREREREMCG